MTGICKKMSLLVLCIAFFSGCSSKTLRKSDNSSYSTRDVFAMDTFMNIKAYGSNAESALSMSEERIYQLEKELSVTSVDSDVWALNHSNGNDVAVCEDTAELIRKAKETGEATEGALDITIYPVLKTWGFTTGNYRVPEKNELKELLDYVDYNSIRIEKNIVRLEKKVEIDLGSLAKGYTGDEIMKIMKKNGVSSAIVSLGGNVQAMGKKPDGSEWKVAVRDPFSTDQDMCVIEIADKAVITSGNYERFFTDENGNNYWHILDPKNGYPADNGLVSVTVIGKSGIDCDALSTALFVMGFDKTVEFWQNEDGFDLILVTDDEKIYYTDGLIESFKNISSMPSEVIKRE